MHERASISDQLAREGTSSSTASTRPWIVRLRTGLRARRFAVTLLGVFTLIVAGITPIALTASASAVVAPRGPSGQSAPTTRPTSHNSTTTYPVGTPDTSQPSREAPPNASHIPGYQLSYVTNFSGNSLPAGWAIFTGKPSGDPGGQWASNHVDVSGNMLRLNTFQDPNFNNNWVAGGVCQCGDHHTYGAFFVRSRMTGPGPTQVAILWPVVGWPPEIDFDETYGGVSTSQATLHYTSANLQIHRNLDINMTAWHTWGVIWTPTSLTYTVDGNVWGTVTEPSIIPDQPMILTLQQQTWCSSGFACPTSPESTDVNWVAEYTSTSTSPKSITLGSFTNDSVGLSRTVRARIRHLAKVIAERGDSAVTLMGYASDVVGRAKAHAVSTERANNVKRYLEKQLASLNDLNVSVVAIGAGDIVASTTTVSARVGSGKVAALLK